MIKSLNPNLNRTLDFARGLAVLLVLFSHLDNYRILIVWPFSYQPLQNFIGHIGVDLFFILSGYLIWASAKKSLIEPKGLWLYAINRITRIYPLYLVCILLIVLSADYYIGQKKPDITFEVITRHLLFLQSFTPNVSDSLNGPFWTLTHEFIFYLLVPVLYFLKPSRWMLITSIVLTQLLFTNIHGMHNFANYWILFAIGMLIQQEHKFLKLTYCILLLLIVCFLCIEYSKIKTLEFMFAGLLFNILINFEFNSVLFNPMIGLGKISYSVYVWHYMLIHLIAPYIKNVNLLIAPLQPWLPFGIAQEALLLIAFILLFSIISYWLIEKPSMTSFRRKLTKLV